MDLALPQRQSLARQLGSSDIPAFQRHRCRWNLSVLSTGYFPAARVLRAAARRGRSTIVARATGDTRAKRLRLGCCGLNRRGHLLA